MLLSIITMEQQQRIDVRKLNLRDYNIIGDCCWLSNKKGQEGRKKTKTK